MANWFQCKVEHRKVMEDGLEKKVVDPYLVDAYTFTEAEARFIEEITPFMNGEFTVQDIKKLRITELFESNDGNASKWFKARVDLVSIDEKSGKDKHVAHNYMVQSTDFAQAVKDLQKCMKDTMSDYVIMSMTETKIMDVFHYQAPGENVKPEFPEA